MKDPVDQRTGKGRLEYFFLVCSLPTRVHCGGGCDLYSFFVGNFFSHFWFLSGLEALLSYLAPADNQEFNTTASIGAFQHHRLGLYQQSFYCECQLLSCVLLFATLWQPTRVLCPWDSPGKNTGMGCHSLFQGTFLTQGSNPSLLHCRWIPYRLSHQSFYYKS